MKLAPRILWAIFLLLSLFFTLYDFFLGNIFDDVFHPSFVYGSMFLIGLLFFLKLSSSQQSEKKQ